MDFVNKVKNEGIQLAQSCTKPVPREYTGRNDLFVVDGIVVRRNPEDVFYDFVMGKAQRSAYEAA